MSDLKDKLQMELASLKLDLDIAWNTRNEVVNPDSYEFEEEKIK